MKRKRMKRVGIFLGIIAAILLVSGGTYLLLANPSSKQDGKNFSTALVLDMSEDELRSRLADDIGYTEDQLAARTSYEGVFRTGEAVYFAATVMRRLGHHDATLRLFDEADRQLDTKKKTTEFYVEYAQAASMVGQRARVAELRQKALQAIERSPEDERVAETRYVERSFAGLEES